VSPADPPTLAGLLGQQAVLPLVEVEDPAVAVALARVLSDGGLPVMEIALRTTGALAAIEAVRASEPAVTVGAGTGRRGGHRDRWSAAVRRRVR
jgi:2-dehydro-3-deoxyphosphogluconate aldolase/(4S)-4-hydroxy-2-oxoglutarate aldolase